jgi:hypothetical protein
MMISMMLGGIRMPKVPDAAMVPQERMTVALAHHGRQGQGRHHGDRCADDTGHGGQHRAHDGDRQGERARHLFQEHLDAVEQVAGDAAALHHHAHEDEGRHRHQNQVLRRLTPDPGQEVEELDQGEHIEEIADQAEQQRQPAQDEGDRKAREQ